jgi:hypothetical protein
MGDCFCVSQKTVGEAPAVEADKLLPEANPETPEDSGPAS